jgi:mono/diheme cytochrome c family protein
MWKRWLLYAVVAVVVVLVLIQLVPYGRNHNNPPVVQEPAWDSPQTQELVSAACADCHSNQTDWPWYTNVAPVSWLVQHDVDEGRQVLNFSESNRRYEADEMVEMVRSGEMPPLQYKLVHSDARLTDAQRQQLIDGFRATFGN